MDNAARIVTRLPLTELWDENGTISAVKIRMLGVNDVAAKLRESKIQFVVADGGHSIVWTPLGECNDFWKKEVKSRIVEPTEAVKGFFIESFPGAYCYIAFEWFVVGMPPVILLEKHH
ncbi:MAG: hypothetical protein V4719_24540 [Planctomycetota bacterium]